MAKATKQSVPSTLHPHQAIPKIQRQIARIDETINLHWKDPGVEAWESTTENLLDAVFGRPDGERHHNTKAIAEAWTGAYAFHQHDHQWQAEHVKTQKKRKALLEAYIEQLEDNLQPVARVVEGHYRFHTEIEKVSGELFKGGHYKSAALEAYIRVIEQVKTLSGLPTDGDSLMNHAFGFDGGRNPVIPFNTMQTDAERDEQKGIMFLFKGLVGLRNAKAHSNTLFEDESRAHEYLSLASLLMRLLDLAAHEYCDTGLGTVMGQVAPINGEPPKLA